MGIPWEQHVTFLEDRRRARSIEGKIRKGVADLGRHPAILAYSIGNEIPAPIVRWYGRRRMEAFLRISTLRRSSRIRKAWSRM